MDLTTLIATIGTIPGAGPYLAPITSIVVTIIVLGTLLSMVVPAPGPANNAVYKFLYEVLQWCALNKMQATNLTAPVNAGTVAGPTAISAPRVAVVTAPAPDAATPAAATVK